VAIREELTVWWARLADARPAHVELLDPIERHRRTEYRDASERDRFTLGAALSRIVLGAHLGVDPSRVPLDRSCDSCPRPHGRPRLPWANGPTFSVSHSEDAVAVAFVPAPGIGVGVDVEPARATQTVMALDVFSPAERLASVSLEPDAVAAMALRAWVRKEAVLKATGDGLRVPMRELTVLHGSPTAPVSWTGRTDGESIWVQDLSWPGPSYVASVAVAHTSIRHMAVVEHDATRLLGHCRRPRRRYVLAATVL